MSPSKLRVNFWLTLSHGTAILIEGDKASSDLDALATGDVLLDEVGCGHGVADGVAGLVFLLGRDRGVFRTGTDDEGCTSAWKMMGWS